MQIASLRSELRALRGAIEAQQPRVAASNQVIRESDDLRAEIAGLSRSMDRRRRALAQIRVSQHDVDALAEQVAETARTAADSIRRDRRGEGAAASATHQMEALPILTGAPPRAQPAQSREQLLDAARERMRRRGVLGGSLPTSSAAYAAPESMFDRLRLLRSAEERVAAAAAAAVMGEPIVDELNLLRGIKDVCSICLEARKAGEAVWVLKCGHCFHAPCARRWLGGSSSCPMCKAAVARRPVAGGGEASQKERQP